MPQLARLMRYPVKGLPGEDLDHAMLAAGEGIANDRRFALTRSVSSTMDGAWMACQSFFINARQDGLLRFSQKLDEAADILHLTSPEGSVVSIDLTDPKAVAVANAQLPLFLWALGEDDAAPFPPMLAERKREAGQLSGYWDFTDSAVSLVNLASVREIEKAAGASVDPVRFRGNLLVEGLEPWEEFAWPGNSLRVGNAVLQCIRPAARCPATSVNPATAARDLTVSDLMTRAFGHNYCGIYANVIKGGRISPGDNLEVLGPGSMPLEEAASHGAPDYRLWPKFAHVVAHDGETTTIGSDGPWPLPAAVTGQRVKLLGIGHHDAAILSCAEGRIMLELAGNDLPERLLVSGPFGRS